MEKRCPDCHNYMASTEFGKNKRTSDGLANYCRVCTSRRNRRQYLANQERRKTEAREYRASNVDLMREREKERWNRRKDVMAEYRASNRPMINKTRAKWMLARPDYYKVWRLENPERVAYEKAWRAAKLGSHLGTHPRALRAKPRAIHHRETGIPCTSSQRGARAL